MLKLTSFDSRRPGVTLHGEHGEVYIPPKDLAWVARAMNEALYADQRQKQHRRKAKR